MKCGKGGYYYVNGNKYQGEWVTYLSPYIIKANDRKNGFGVYNYSSTGEKYEGEWKDGDKVIYFHLHI